MTDHNDIVGPDTKPPPEWLTGSEEDGDQQSRLFPANSGYSTSSHSWAAPVLGLPGSFQPHKLGHGPSGISCTGFESDD